MAFNDSDFRIAHSRIPQTDYVTATAEASGAFTQLIATDPAGAKIKQTTKRSNNKGHSTGKRFASESHVEAWETELSYQFEASSQNLGPHLLAALGALATTTPSASYYKHAFTPIDFNTSQQAPAYSFVQKLNEANDGLDDLGPSFCLESLELSGDGTGRIAGSAAWRGSGEMLAGTDVVWADHVDTAEGNQNYFYNTQAEITIGTHPSNGSPANMDCDLERWMLSLKSTFATDAAYRPGCPRYQTSGDPESGVLRSEMLITDQEIAFDFTIRLQADDPRRVHFRAQTKLEGKIVVTGSEVNTGNNNKLEVTFFLLKYAAHEHETKDGFVLVKITPEILYSNTDSKIVQVDLYNGVASYLS